MPYDTPLAPQKTRSAARFPSSVTPLSRNVRETAGASNRAGELRPIEPMLLVYQQRVETFRLIAAALRRAFRVFARSFAT
jgi:hypothetical protein